LAKDSSGNARWKDVTDPSSHRKQWDTTSAIPCNTHEERVKSTNKTPEPDLENSNASGERRRESK
jgi:hypothetical protein